MSSLNKSYALIVKIRLPAANAEELLHQAEEIKNTLLAAEFDVESVAPWQTKELKARKAPVPSV
jgi:hypothetical protein